MLLEKIDKSSKLKTIITAVVLFAFLICLTGFELNAIIKNDATNIGMAKGFCLIAFVTLVVMLFLLLKINNGWFTPQKQFLIITGFCAALYMIIFPAFSVPDEPAHFFSAYRISNFMMFKPNEIFSKEFTIRKSDLDFYLSDRTVLNKNLYLDTYKNFSFFIKDNNYVKFSMEFVDSAPAAYIVPALAITIARILHLGTVPTILLGRICNTVTVLILGYFSTKIIPFGKSAVLAIFCLPMSLHVMSSYSYDGIITALAIFLVSQILYFREKEAIITKKEWVIFIISSVLLVPMKIVYFPFMALIFLVPDKNISANRKKANLIKTVYILAMVVTFASLEIFNIVKRLTAVDSANYSGEGVNYSFYWTITHIKETLYIFINTLQIKMDFYIKSFFGYSLGWFQVELPLFLMLPFFVLLLLSFFRRKNEKGVLTYSNKLYVFCIFAVISVFILYVMLISWTLKGTFIIDGVQGRYFIPLAILIFILIRGEDICVNPSIDKYLAFAFLVENYIVISAFFTRIIKM